MTLPLETAAAGSSSTAKHYVTDKRGYAERWHFGPRMIDNLLAQGLPHLAVGKRRVRILVAEADVWMRERYGTRRIGPIARVPTPVAQETAKGTTNGSTNAPTV